MRMAKAALLGVAALGTLAGGALAVAPYDFAGHWTGTIVAAGDGDTPDQCTVKGKAKRRLSVSMRATCGDGGTVNFHGRVNPDKQTIAGTFVEKRKRRSHRGTFTLGRSAGTLKG